MLIAVKAVKLSSSAHYNKTNSLPGKIFIILNQSLLRIQLKFILRPNPISMQNSLEYGPGPLSVTSERAYVWYTYDPLLLVSFP